MAIVKLVGTMLATYTDRMTGEAWPSVKRLASECGLCRSTIQRALRTIERLGWFERRHAGYGGRRSCTYLLRLGQLATPDAEPRTDQERASRSDRSSNGNNSSISRIKSDEHRVICNAYSRARKRKHNAGMRMPPARKVLERITYFVAELATELDQSFEAMAEETMVVYLKQPSRRDGELERRCHPIEWLLYDLGPVERDIRKRLQRRTVRPDPSMSVEVSLSRTEQAAHCSALLHQLGAAGAKRPGAGRAA